MAQGVCGNDLTVCFPSGGVTVLGQDTPVWQFWFVQLGQGIDDTFLIEFQPLNQGLAPGLDATQTQIDNLHTLALAFPGPNLDGRTVKFHHSVRKGRKLLLCVIQISAVFAFVAVVQGNSCITPDAQSEGKMSIHLQYVPNMTVPNTVLGNNVQAYGDFW